MPKNKLPPEVIKHWPEIFEDVEIKSIPIEYIHTVHVRKFTAVRMRGNETVWTLPWPS